MRNPTYAVTFYRMLILKKRQSTWNTGSWALAITFAITTQRMNVGRSQNFSLSRYLNFVIAVAKFLHPRVWWTMRSELKNIWSEFPRHEKGIKELAVQGMGSEE